MGTVPDSDASPDGNAHAHIDANRDGYSYANGLSYADPDSLNARSVRSSWGGAGAPFALRAFPPVTGANEPPGPVHPLRNPSESPLGKGGKRGRVPFAETKGRFPLRSRVPSDSETTAE